MCRACVDLRARWAIRTPGELSKAVRVVQANLGDGRLVDITESVVPLADGLRPTKEDQVVLNVMDKRSAKSLSRCLIYVGRDLSGPLRSRL
jgi:hypothetical protein